MRIHDLTRNSRFQRALDEARKSVGEDPVVLADRLGLRYDLSPAEGEELSRQIRESRKSGSEDGR